MPAGLIDEQRGGRARRDLGGDFGQVEVYGFGVASGRDEGCALAVLGADCAEDIGGGGSLIFGCARSAAALGPPAGDLVLLADARLVGEPDLYGVGSDALLATDLFQALGKTFFESLWMRGFEFLRLVFLIVAAETGRYWGPFPMRRAACSSTSQRPGSPGPSAGARRPRLRLGLS